MFVFLMTNICLRFRSDLFQQNAGCVSVEYSISFYSGCNSHISCAMKFLRELIFAYWRFFLFLRLGQIGFTCWELIFAISESAQYQALITFSFLLSTSNRNTYFQAINHDFVYFVVSE